MEEDYKTEEPRIRIENVTQLSKEKAIKLKERGIKKVVLLPKEFLSKSKREELGIEYVVLTEKDSTIDTYNIDTYIAILDKLYELTEGVTKDMPEDERFAIIYERVCKSIEYDHEAKHSDDPVGKEYRDRVKDTSRNLQNGLLEGKCVCVGYAEILRNALALCGIDCEYVGSGNHAWNKVKLQGVWFNVDATSDRYYFIHGERPQHALKSDEDFTKKGYGEEIVGPECYITEPEYVIKDLFQINPHLFLTQNVKDILDSYKDDGEKLAKIIKGRKKDFLEDVKSSGIRVALVNMATLTVKDFVKGAKRIKDDFTKTIETIKDL